MKKASFLSLIVVLAIATAGSAKVIYYGSGPGYTTLQAAIDDCNDGDTVIVPPGRYYENINFRGKAITVSSINPDDPNIVESTIIDANGLASVVTFASDEGPDAVLTGFTITGGKGTLDTSSIYDIYWGAGIYCYGASPTITDNVIADNNSFTKIEGDEIIGLGYGGGISCLQSGAIITRNIIRENNAYAGAGIVVLYGNPAIISNLIHDNSGGAGGGVVLLEGGRLTSDSEQPGDLNHDGVVNAKDFAILAEEWRQKTVWWQELTDATPPAPDPMEWDANEEPDNLVPETDETNNSTSLWVVGSEGRISEAKTRSDC